MELSLVLWNCDGKNGPRKATVEERQDVFESTYDSWQQKNMIPTVLLAQQLYSGVTKTWRKLSKESNLSGTLDAACFFLKYLGQKVEFLDSGKLQRIMDSILDDNDRYDEGIGRIHCGIVTLGSEKILICSWHGQYNKKTKKELLRKMLLFVDKIKKDQGCVAALVGGDFNLDKTKVDESDILKAYSAVLYGDYENPPYRPSVIDYVIAWPENRFKLLGLGAEIKTDPPEIDDANPRMFDHALIRYDFRVMLKGEWKGKGEVKWCGERRGEGEVTLTGANDEETSVRVRDMTGEWEGKGNGFCSGFDKLEIEGGKSFKVNENEKGWSPLAKGNKRILTNEMCKNVEWKGRGQLKWEITEGECRFTGDINCEQTVKWNGTGEIKWNGEGEATWLEGRLEKWKGNQTVRWADDQAVQWTGGGEVELLGEFDNKKPKGNWAVSNVEGGLNFTAEDKASNKLEWSGKGVIWEVTGTGTGKMCDT